MHRPSSCIATGSPIATKALLRRVVDESFCSSWGDDALMALGDLALERGDYATARRTWEQISPLLRAPNGSPMWLALRDIDLNAKWPEVERRWQTREKPADWLAYPDTQLDLAEVRARLVLASIRAGELDRAALELQVFRRLHPNATGQFGGQKENFAAALERLLTAAREWPAEPAPTDWPTFAGSHSRSTVAATIGPDLVSSLEGTDRTDSAQICAELCDFVQGGVGGDTTAKDEPDAAVRESQRPLSCYPIVIGQCDPVCRRRRNSCRRSGDRKAGHYSRLVCCIATSRRTTKAARCRLASREESRMVFRG